MDLDFISIEKLSAHLTEKLNGASLENIENYGINSIYPRTQYKFIIHSETGEYVSFERSENTVTRFINGEMTVIGSDTEGVGESTYNAVVQTRVDFLVPLIGPEKKNRELLKCLRALLTETLKYTENDSEECNGTTYVHITDYSILESGIREMREAIGDSVSLTIYVTHTFVSQGVSSSRIKIKILNPVTEKWDVVPYAKLGVARKNISEVNVAANVQPTRSRSIPTSSLLTVNIDLLTRLGALDYYVANYTYSGVSGLPQTLHVEITRPNPEYYIRKENDMSTDGVDMEKSTNYNMLIDVSGINCELGAISSTSVTLVEEFTT